MVDHTPEQTIDEKQEAVIREFERLGGDWMERYKYLISLGKTLPPMDSKLRSEPNRLKGCQSRVWLHTSMEEGKLYFAVDSDASIVKGIAALLVKVLSGHTPDQIKTAGLYFIDRIGLKSHLSPVRSNGLFSLLEAMKASAEAHSAEKVDTPEQNPC